MTAKEFSLGDLVAKRKSPFILGVIGEFNEDKKRVKVITNFTTKEGMWFRSNQLKHCSGTYAVSGPDLPKWLNPKWTPDLPLDARLWHFYGVRT